MAVEVYSNNASTTLATSINNSTTSISVASSSGFPTTGNFRILMDQELMLVTALSGTTWTVVRGIEGTNAQSHTNTVAITHILTAGGLAQGISDREFVPCGTFVTTDTVVNNTTHVFDWTITADDGYLLGGSGTSQLTVPTKGYYLFNGYIHWQANNVGFRIVEWRKNGTLYLNGSGLDASTDAADDIRQEVTILILLAAGDVIELTAFQNTSVTLNLTFGSCSVTQISARP